MKTVRTVTLLTIEDDRIVRKTVVNHLARSGFRVFEAGDGVAGLDVFHRERPDLVLVDLRMPGLDGFGVLEAIARDSPETPVVVVSGTDTVDEAIRAMQLGAWDFISKPIQDMGVLDRTIHRILDRAELLREKEIYQSYIEKEIVRRTAQLEQRTRELEAANDKLTAEIAERARAEEALCDSLLATRKAMEGTINVLSIVGEFRDPYTAGHQRRVAQLARAIAESMDLPAAQVACVHLAALVHDIGKIAIPIEILCKPGRISDVEFSIIRTHPQVGFEILKTVEFPWPIAPIVLQHQEHLDGSGYPAGLKGREVCIEAQILAAADVVESIGSHRPYRPTLGLDKALEEIGRCRDVWFEGRVVDACIRLFRDERFTFEAVPSFVSHVSEDWMPASHPEHSIPA